MAESIGSNSAFQHVLEEIFGNLNINDLNSCQLVCKYWRTISEKVLKNPYFWLKNNNLGNAIYAIARSGNFEALQSLKTTFTNRTLLANCHERDANGREAIHIACQKGNLKIVEFLTDSNQSKRCIIKQITLKNGTWSPLHYASYFGHAKIVKHLIKLLDEMAVKTSFGDYKFDAFWEDNAENAYRLAINKRHFEVMKVFLQYDHNLTGVLSDPENIEGIEVAVVIGNIEVTKSLMPFWVKNYLDEDYDGELLNQLYNRLSEQAAIHGHLEIMKWVIRKVSNPFVVATKLAQKYGCDEIVDFVKSSGLAVQPPAKKRRFR